MVRSRDQASNGVDDSRTELKQELCPRIGIELVELGTEHRVLTQKGFVDAVERRIEACNTWRAGLVDRREQAVRKRSLSSCHRRSVSWFACAARRSDSTGGETGGL
jgi:hypothetical protein